MFVTEEQAHQMWCPFVRVEGSNRIYNTMTDGFANTTEAYHCLGTKCMAWRATHPQHLKHGAELALRGHGFCGLASRPEFE